jgi:hypothetical protein
MDIDELSAAIVLFLGFGIAKAPRADAASLMKKFGRATGLSLLAQIHHMLADMDSIATDWSKQTLAEAGHAMRTEMQRRFPTLNAKALDALAWKFTFDWR